MFIQALLVALIVAVAFNDRVFLHTFMYRPIVIGPLVGLVFGNLNIGLQVGVAVELMFLAVIWVGTLHVLQDHQKLVLQQHFQFHSLDKFSVKQSSLQFMSGQ